MTGRDNEAERETEEEREKRVHRNPGMWMSCGCGSGESSKERESVCMSDGALIEKVVSLLVSTATVHQRYLRAVPSDI